MIFVIRVIFYEGKLGIDLINHNNQISLNYDFCDWCDFYECN